MGRNRKGATVPQWLTAMENLEFDLWTEHSVLTRLEIRHAGRRGVHTIKIRTWATADHRPLAQLAEVAEEYPSQRDESYDSAVFRLTNECQLRTEEALAIYLAQKRLI